MGIKLVYYKIDNGALTFGSEIRADPRRGTAPPDVDPVALNLFLRFRYTPSPLTISKVFENSRRERCWFVENGGCREERWYNYTPVPFPDRKEEKEAARGIAGIVSRRRFDGIF